MKIDPGELDQRVRHLRAESVPDGAGGSTRTLTTLGIYWARVRPLSGSEQAQFDRVNARALTVFIFRWRSVFKESDVLEWRGVQYNIRFIQDRGPRSSFLLIQAERGVAV